jgi:hypothetical protein
MTAWLVILLLATTAGSAAEPAKTLSPVTIFRWTTAEGTERFTTPDYLPGAARDAAATKPVFRALPVDQWPAGLVPLYEIPTARGFELRRRPSTGQEAYTDPAFFIFPREDEVDTTRIAGVWECQATRGNNNEPRILFELTAEDGRVTGRFDQGTEYKFATVTSGVFASNRLTLSVAYVNDTYEMTADWRAGELRGKWRKTDDSESGTWQAKREHQNLVMPGSEVLVPLYEWRHAAKAQRSYSVTTNIPGEGWVRQPRPLGRVWRPLAEPGNGK